MSSIRHGRLVIPASLPKTTNKYGAIKKAVDGIIFDSVKESERYLYLRHLEKAGEISELRLQVIFKIFVQGELICEYRADFTYRDQQTGNLVVEDVKSKYTSTLPVYRLKKKLMWAVHKIQIQEV